MLEIVNCYTGRMNPSWLLNEWRRRQRLRNPKKFDFGSHTFMTIMGTKWLVDNGFHREYGISKMHVDFAQPEWGLVIEVDGDRYHMDVLRDQRRDEYLRKHGWYVVRFRYNDLVFHPTQIRDKLVELRRNNQPPTPAERKELERQLRKSGL